MMMEERKPCAVNWHRSPLEPADMRSLHKRSNWKGLLQTLSYLGIIAATGAGTLLAAGRLPVAAVLLLLFLHGMVCSFLINGVHELGHGTVFRTMALNAFFVRILAFLGWINFEMFSESHIRHHRYTLHPPDDLEVVLPLRVLMKQFFLTGFINPRGIYYAVKETIRIARGGFRGEWELTLFPALAAAKRSRPVNWARTLLVGHALVFLVAIYTGLWLLPVVVSLTPSYGGWLFFLCNNTQHIGLQDNVPDFRLCCRTFTLNPFVRFLYWHMNYHTEHHMYAAVPCYNLTRLHELIKHDLPPCPHGLVATWKEIAAIQKRQEADPSYQYAPVLPGSQPA